MKAYGTSSKEVLFYIFRLSGQKPKEIKKDDIEKTCTAKDFELSLGICEDVLNMINIDMFEGGLTTLSTESQNELFTTLVKNGLPFFREMIQELFDLTDEEVKKTKLSDIVKVVIDIVKYSFSQLASSLGGKKEKN